MIIVSVSRYRKKTPCQQTIINFCNRQLVNWVSAVWDESKCIFDPSIQELPNRNWAWINLPDAKFPGRFTLEPTYTWSQEKPIGYHLDIHLTEKTLFVIETPWIKTFDLDGGIIPTELIKMILHASDLPHYEAGYGAGEREDYSDIPGTTRTAFVDGTIPEEWVPVEWIGCEADDGYKYVRMPEEFYPFLDPKDFPSLSLAK